MSIEGDDQAEKVIFQEREGICLLPPSYLQKRARQNFLL